MHVSVNELQMAVAKASTGTGMPVGLAEENAGIAVALAAHGVNAVAAAADVLRSYRNLGREQPIKRVSASHFRFNAGGSSCLPAAWHMPLACLWLCGKVGRWMEIRNVDNILWVAGAVMRASDRLREDLAIISVETEKPLLVCRQGKPLTALETLSDKPEHAFIVRRLAEHDFVAAPAPRMLDRSPAEDGGIAADRDDWNYLLELGDRMLVESSEYSRIHGAGYVA